MKKQVFTVAVCALGLATTMMLNSCGSNEGQQAMEAPSLQVMTVTESDNATETSLPATIKGKTDIDIRPQVSGFITKVHVDEGQQVSKGQVLFTLDQVQFQAAVDQAQAAVAAAQTNVANCQLTADNKKSLYDKNIISQYEWQTAVNALQAAKAQLAQANAALVNARKNLAYTVVTAPCSGVVGKIPNREGSLASPSSMEPLTTVSDISSVYAYFSLPESKILELSNEGGQSLQAAINMMPEVQLRLADGTMYPHMGKIATISGVIDQSTGAASVRALFPNSNGYLRSGSTGNIVIPSNSQNVIVIPQKATYELQDRVFVYVVGDSNKVASAPVTVTRNNDGKTYVVNSGLKAGQRIVVEGVGSSSVRDGMVINPVEGAAKKEAAPAAAPEAKPEEAK